MSRPLRYDREGGWYHVTSRGIDRRLIFKGKRDCEHFIDLLKEAVERFGVRVHAYVLMGNHYHLIVETPEANLSRAVQWVNVSYVAWFNRRWGRVGPLMQGRFKALVVQDAAWAYELSLYVHLNPVMRRGLGLDKRSKRAEGQGLVIAGREEVGKRLAQLREYPWSSYRAYGGYEKVPDWLTTEAMLERADREKGRRVAAYRRDVRERVSKGGEPGKPEELRDAFALGTEEFRAKVRKLARWGRETSEPRRLTRRLSWADVISAVESVTGAESRKFMQQRGVVARPLVLWAARRFGRMTLREIGQAVGGLDYTAVAMAIRRLEDRTKRDHECATLMDRVRIKCEE